MEYADILEHKATDSGQCEVCGEHLDSGRCDCSEQEREEGYQGCTCRGENCYC